MYIDVGHSGNSVASASFLAVLVVEQARMQSYIRLESIERDIHRLYGIKIPYGCVLAAEELIFGLINGIHEESYAILPKHCQELVAANHESFVEFERTDMNQFRHLFLCYNVSARGFESCKPPLGLDETHLKSKYQGILFTVTAMDAHGQLFPFAFGMIDIEDKNNWL